MVLELQRQKKEIKDLYFLVSALHDMLQYKKGTTTFVLKRKVPFIQKMNSTQLTQYCQLFENDVTISTGF